MSRVAVVGGGAAGLMAAWWAASAGAEVTLLESQKACGRKILISGGGRCNLLPSASEDDDFSTQGSRHVLRRLFKTWPLARVHAWFETELGLELVLEEESGKLFPSEQRARPVRDRFVEAVEARGVAVENGWRLAELVPDGGSWRLRSEDDRVLSADRVVLATGGRSVPSTGSDGFGYELARGLGHAILPTYPALVPLTTSAKRFHDLSGVSVPVRWRALLGGKVREEREREMLFTHTGFSGPAVLDASHWVVRDGATLEVSWAEGSREEWHAHLRGRARRSIEKAVSDLLPRRLATMLVGESGLRGEMRVGNMSKAQWERLLTLLSAYPLPIDGDAGFRVAEVTGGGVPLGELDPSTLESRRAPGLFLCGEILDVVGRIGGYNFLWAWVTGRLAGESAARA